MVLWNEKYYFIYICLVNKPSHFNINSTTFSLLEIEDIVNLDIMRANNVNASDLRAIGMGGGSRRDDPHYEMNGYKLRCILRSDNLNKILDVLH